MLPEPTISKTPLTQLTAFGEGLYGKLEYVHPTRSAKFRALTPHLYGLAKAGELKRSDKVVIRSAGCAAETTAWVCRRLGIPAEAILPKRLEEPDIVDVLTRLGAVVHQFDPDQATRYMAEMEAEPGAYVLDQFHDPRVADYYRPLAAEILEEQPACAAIVVGIGTAASIMGVAHEVRDREAACRVIGVWPAEFDPTWSRPFRPHGISGLAPPVRETHLDRTLIDDIVMVPSDDAKACEREIFIRAGLPVGTSSGATLEAALRLRHAGMHGPLACIFASTVDCHLPDEL